MFYVHTFIQTMILLKTHRAVREEDKIDKNQLFVAVSVETRIK